MSSAAPKVFTSPLTREQADTLEGILREDGFRFEPRPYTLFFAQKGKVSVAVYEKGPKVVVQGRDSPDFITFILEPRVLGEAKVGYEDVHHPERFEPHFGIDESGKGDFFGPLVIAGVYVDGIVAREFLDAGVTDSKRIGSDARIRALAAVIRKSRTAQTLIVIPPQKYNQLIEKMGNVNRLLAWGHARAIENLCAERPDCPRALSDKFANVHVLERALMAQGRKLRLDQQTKAESDYAVAAASILAREAYIDWMDAASKRVGVHLPRGVSEAVKSAARQVVERGGAEALAPLAKMHFKTFEEVLSGPR
ncbi:MAG: ribonuclease HIII [Terrimicrobiaceae bacterium]